MTLLIILAVLFLALFIIIPLVEKKGKRYSPEELQKLSRWIYPLMGLILFASLIKMMFF